MRESGREVGHAASFGLKSGDDLQLIIASQSKQTSGLVWRRDTALTSVKSVSTDPHVQLLQQLTLMTVSFWEKTKHIPLSHLYAFSTILTANVYLHRIIARSAQKIAVPRI